MLYDQHVYERSMNNVLILFLVLISTTQLVGCTDSKTIDNESKKTVLSISWWESIEPIVIDGDEFYGKPCSVVQITSNEFGAKSEAVIFTVPSRLLTSCAQRQPNKNYLEYDGKYIILHVDRQTFGAGSWTGERYRSKDLTSWEEYIGVTWLKSEEYEAWRKVGSKSSKADSLKKVMQD